MSSIASYAVSTQTKGFGATGRTDITRQGDAGWGVANKEPTHLRRELVWTSSNDGVRYSYMVVVPIHRVGRRP